MSDFIVSRGDNLDWDGVAKVSATDPTPLDLSSCIIRMTAKRRHTDTDAEAIWQETTIGGGIVITNPALGIFTISVLPISTGVLTAKTVLYYDVQVEDSTGKVFTVDRGTVTVLMDTTRSTVALPDGEYPPDPPLP